MRLASSRSGMLVRIHDAVLILSVLPIAAVRAQSAAQAPVPAPQGPVVFVVAPSGSTAAEARRLLRFCRWTDTTALRDADLVMVVVRSSSGMPMAPSYDSMKWLRDEANSLLNESGAQFHIYLYTIRQDLSMLEVSHRSYDVSGFGAFPSGGSWRWQFGCG
jgi:hypothetical protein